jgi:mRNA-degrading endonuclease RelE of RelBE toxin-antitoxin system
MRYEFKPSFDKSVKTLSSENKQEIKELCIHLIDVLSGERELSVGLGLKNLKKNFWEIRKGLKLRILFRWSTDYVEFILAGTHDDIKRFLKRYKTFHV